MTANNHLSGGAPPTPSDKSTSLETEILPQDCVLIIGGGPVGLCLSVTLAHFGVKSLVVERNETTTRWPKMDLTNVRSMELFRRLGLAQGLREQGVPPHIPYNVRMTIGLNAEAAITNWFHPSVDEYRVRIATKNDGTMPLEPYQRISQAIFEEWLKSRCDQNPLIDLQFNHKLEEIEETDGGVRAVITDQKSGVRKVIFSRYAAGCDGGSSKVRRSLNIPLHGGPIPAYILLVHFKSRDLQRLHAQGRFWHLFFVGNRGLAGACIAQNEVDTWTTHLVLPLDQDSDNITSQEAIETVLGGQHGRFPVKIDEVLVRSTYRPTIAISETFSSPHGHIFLAGDAAHQNIPTGGYGMNMGIADSFELGWKLAMVINGFAEPHLMASYDCERRPVVQNTIERSGVHMKVHMDVGEIFQGRAGAVNEDSEQGRQLRQEIHEHYQKNDGENFDLGIEMGYRYESHAILADKKSQPPDPTPLRYVPSTYPGCRAPHVYLNDGSAIFDHYGRYYSLVDFSDGSDSGSDILLEAAQTHWMPLKHVRLSGEDHAHRVWGERLVVVRPDGHVVWRAAQIRDLHEAMRIVAAMRGAKEVAADSIGAKLHMNGAADHSAPVNGTSAPPHFTSTVELASQTDNYEMERMGEFQQ